MIIIPLIFLITSFVVDYVLFATSGLQAFDYKSAYASSVPPDEYPSDEQYDDPTLDPLVNSSPTTTFVFLFCTLANFMSFFMAWFYLYDTAKAEWQTLQVTAADADQGGDVETEDGHVSVPGNAVLLAEEGANASHLYGDVLGDDLDGPKSVVERIADRDKARLMKQFFFAVSIYIIMAMVVFFVPLFVPMVVDAALLIAYDSLLWLFMAGLLIVFRMRDSNQFLLLTDSGLGGGETTTELGVLYHDDDHGDTTATATPGVNDTPSGRVAGPTASSRRNHKNSDGRKANGAGKRVTPRFTLEDEDEEDQKDRDFPDKVRVNDRAAQHGVIVESLPSPHA